MKKYLILLGLSFFAACGGGEKSNAPLQDSLAKTNQTMVDIMSKIDTNAVKEAILNKQYFYAIGSFKDLKDKGILTKEGKFPGIDKIYELTPDFDNDYFTKVDISVLKEILLNGAKKIKIVTTHPSDSYKFSKTSSSYDTLIILNKEKFWEDSKYLVIIAEK